MKNLTLDYRQISITIMLLILLLTCSNINAQNKWELTFRPGINFPTQDLGDTKLSTGFGAEATIGYRFQPHLSAFVGWSWNTFPSKDFPSKLDFEETGYSFGFQFNHPISTYKLNYVVGLAGIYNHIEVENNNGDIISDTGHGLGWQAEAGVSYEINSSFRLTPTIRYRSLSRDITFGSVSTPVDLNYVAFNLAATWCF